MKSAFSRILIARTDRIGDVVLSTPVIKALRDRFPDAYIAMMVSPLTRELVCGNPYLDEVIVYDKERRHKGLFGSLKAVFALRRRRLDLAVILHSTNRVNLITFLAGIRRRIGYARRLGFLLTDAVPYCKYQGKMHEVDYNLGLLRCIGITPQDKALFVPKDENAERWADDVFRNYGLRPGERLAVIHPSASCPSRRWPIESFSRLSREIILKYNARIVIISGKDDMGLSARLARLINPPKSDKVIDLSGQTTLMQLASVLRRAALMISTDSGPVHIAVGCGLPVVVLFGRAQPGLSPQRWGPLGEGNVVLHKKAGCEACLAHNCRKGFICLKSIRVEDVIKAVDRILKG
ncbi:MAG: glycosyltransferase family 9 protein [Candidatus Omnitrophota bacterium]